MQAIPVLETERLIIRPFCRDDLASIQQILDVNLGDVNFGSEGAITRPARQAWLEWTIMNYRQLEELRQPPYGDRAVELKSNGALIGAVGFVPSFGPFEQLPSLGGVPSLNTPEFGLYYAISPDQQRKGYAYEAAKALAGYAFSNLRLKRLVATTTIDNAASIAVMIKLGMRVEQNPFFDPPWFQVVGMLENVLR